MGAVTVGSEKVFSLFKSDAQPPRKEDVYDKIASITAFKPYKHQRDGVNKAVELLSRDGFAALFCDMGTGKTKMTLDTFAAMAQADVLLVICPKPLMGVWMDEIPKHSRLPFSIYRWKSGASKADDRAFNEFVSTGAPSAAIFNIEAFQVPNRKLIERMRDIRTMGRVLMVVDECFHGDTLIDTIGPDGSLSPSYIKEVEIGTIVLNAFGYGKVVGKSSTEHTSLCEVSYNGRRVACSKNHLFLTTNGWVRAVDLQPGDLLVGSAEAVRVVRRGVCPKAQAKEQHPYPFLLSVLLSEMESETTGHHSHTEYSAKKSENICCDEGMVCERFRFGESEQRAHKGTKPYVESTVETEMLTGPEGYRSSSSKKMRKRLWHDRASKALDWVAWWRLGAGVADTNKETARDWVPDMLQSRHWKQSYDDSDRGGRPFTQCYHPSRGRQEEGEAIGFIRVESVEVLEQGDSRLDKYRDPDGRIRLYDIKVDGHPSFSVNGALVHNCSYIKDVKAKRTKNIISLGARADYRMILTGTEVVNSPLDLYAQFEFLKTGFWGVRSYFQFRMNYAILQDAYGAGGRTFKKVVGFRDVDKLANQIAPYIFRALKDECLDLPEKVRSVIHVELTEKQRRYYKELQKHLATVLESGEVVTVENKVSLFTKFRQISGGTIKAGDEHIVLEDCPEKMEALLADVESHNEQAIVWAAFTHEIELISRALSKVASTVTFYGEVSQDNREENVRSFQNGEARFFVANPSSAGFGLNLQNAHIQYVYSRHLSPAVNWQAEDRTHRVGQKNVCIYKTIVARGTVDEAIEEMLAAKTDLREAFRSMNNEAILKLCTLKESV